MTVVKQRSTRWFWLATIMAVGLVLSTLLLTSQSQAVKVFAGRKPGLWGEPAWYLGLMLSYGMLVLLLVVNTILFAHGAMGEAIYKRHVLLLLSMTLIRGLFYSSMAPPWQSPDEHAHFEYAALMGQLGRVPTRGDLSPKLQERIVSSMFDYDFWRLIKRQPVESPPVGLLPQEGLTYAPPTHVIDNRFLYHPQVGKDPPLYYIAPALVHLVSPQSDVALQLYAMRLTTVLTLMALMGAVIWATRRLFPNDMLLAMGIPTLVALHPMLAHMGSVLNNDVPASVFTTLILGMLVIVLRSGLDWRRSLILAGLSLLGLFTRQSTVWSVALIGVVGLVYGSRVSVWVRYLALAIGVGALALFLSVFIPSRQARYWTPMTPSWGATATHTASLDGDYALRVVGEHAESVLGQNLLSQPALDLRGQTIILTAQVRTDTGEHPGWLTIVDLDHETSEKASFTANPEWQTIALQFPIPDDAAHLQIALTSAPQSALYFDRITIANSAAPDVPVEWLRNGSGEQVRSLGEIAAVEIGRWLGVSGTIQRIFSLWQENLQGLLSDPQPIVLGYRSFWGNFGAALVVPLPEITYRILSLACGVSGIGLGIYVWRSLVGKGKTRQVWQQLSLIILGAALLFACLETLLPLLALYGLWAPQGRYLFPVILPIGVFLVLGWAQLVPNRRRQWLLAGLVLGMVMLDYTALRLLADYFYGI
jgi:hypothetical protein